MPSSVTSNRNGVKKLLGYITCIHILNLMVLLGCMLNYMLRVNFAFAIVEMIVDPTNTTTFQNLTASNASTITSTKSVHRYHWNVQQKNLMLGSFYWGYVITQLLGGRLAEVMGARKVFGGGLLVTSTLTLLIPLACMGDYIPVVFLRALMGLFSGTTFVSVPPIAAKWIPPFQRSKFMSHITAAALGAAFTMPLCGWIIRAWGWESVFYITGGVGLAWSVAWFFLIYDSPAQHPRISKQERERIESRISTAGLNVGKTPKRIPWVAMLTSAPVWANVLGVGCVTFAFHIMLNQLPTYMREVLHYDVESNGILSSLPYLAKYCMALISGYCADKLLASGKLSTLTIRNIFTFFSMVMPGLLMAVQAVYGYIPVTSVTLFTAVLFFNGGVTGGVLPNGLDIAPNFAGTILGMGNFLAAVGGWFSTFMIAAITDANNTFSQWQYVFWISSAIFLFGGFIFFVFAKASVQPWNSINSETEEAQLQVFIKKQDETLA